jgi:hypothetical protein
MRIATMIFVGSVTALVASGAALAKHSESRKTDTTSEASCHAYQQAADGSWKQVPCQESGNSQTERRTATKRSEEERR